jgi:hypothetical protein
MLGASQPSSAHAAEATLIHPSAWKESSGNFALMEFSEIRVRQDSYSRLYEP